ncbi:MAG: PQQ-binding-like beta-propeller repeat protein [Candidatus Nealsonbacteria bacterium]|nr:PQQ-binding-like beta-propeller repeat protein [Candidatus Nealsonbacteria bacterium]
MFRTLVGIVVLLLPGATLWAAETAEVAAWNQHRGPGGSGVARASRPPVKLDTNHIAWEAPVAYGLSSPVLGGNRIFLTAEEGGRLVTLAFDAASGKPAWRKEAPEVSIEKVHKTNSPASSTPLVDNERVYVYFGSYGLLCYDHEGREQWTRPIPTPRTLYGMATSPIAYEDRLILVLDNDNNLPDSKLSQSKILAVRKSDGETVWQTPRPFHRSGWSTPTIWRHGDATDLVVLGNSRVAGYDPRTGAKKWFVTGFSRETISMPVCGGGHVYVSAAMLGGVPDDQPDPQPFWDAVMQFDGNGDEKLQRSEMTEHFTFPFRPELPPGHPGYGMPLPEDKAQRKGRLDGMFGWVDKDKDGFWTREEFLATISFRRGKPMLVAIRPGGEGDVTETHLSWQLHRSIPEIPSPVFYKDRLYMVRNGGVLTAVDATNGEILYRKRLGGTGQYSASPVVAGEHIYLASNDGLVSVVKVGDEFELVYERDMGQPVFVTPAVDASTIYIRTKTKLLAFRRPD